MANPLYLLRLSIGRVILWFTDIVPDGWMSGASMTPRTDRRVELLKLVVRRVCQNRLEALSNPILPKTGLRRLRPKNMSLRRSPEGTNQAGVSQRQHTQHFDEHCAGRVQIGSLPGGSIE